jgi:hypothetical protein
LYNCHEVTNLLKKGANAIGVTAGNGFYYINQERYVKFVNAYGEPSLIAQLRLRYSDGSVETIVTDQSWKCTPSPINYSSIYGGEDYDARLEQTGWTMPGFDDSNWKNALTVKAPPGNLMAENGLSGESDGGNHSKRNKTVAGPIIFIRFWAKCFRHHRAESNRKKRSANPSDTCRADYEGQSAQPKGKR